MKSHERRTADPGFRATRDGFEAAFYPPEQAGAWAEAIFDFLDAGAAWSVAADKSGLTLNIPLTREADSSTRLLMGVTPQGLFFVLGKEGIYSSGPLVSCHRKEEFRRQPRGGDLLVFRTQPGAQVTLARNKATRRSYFFL